MSDPSVVLKHPGAFAIQTLKGFRANQGILLAGAVAYYALLSIVPPLLLYRRQRKRRTTGFPVEPLTQPTP
jgi:hypothetical protein